MFDLFKKVVTDTHKAVGSIMGAKEHFSSAINAATQKPAPTLSITVKK